MSTHDNNFYKRLTIACDQCEFVPAYGRGRQTHISKFLDVSPEAARKYFISTEEGGTKPRGENLSKLAKYLGVDEAWLALGITPTEINTKRQRHYSPSSDGYIYVVLGILMLNGATCAVAKDTDDADLFMIYNGEQRSLKVIVATEKTNDEYVFDLLQGEDDIDHIGLIKRSDTSFDLIMLDNESFPKYGKKMGSSIMIVAERTGRSYSTGEHKWQNYIKG